MPPDFDMNMVTSKPSFQRVAVAKSLQQLAPRVYMSSTKNRDMVPFVQQIQKRWRLFAALLKKNGYTPFDSKKFGYARNCVPALVSAHCDGGSLVPCRMFMCPFCWSRFAVIKACKLLEPHKNNIANWRWGHVNFGGGWGLQPSDRDFKDYDTNIVEAMKRAHGSMPAYAGTISYTYIWGNPDSETPSFSGRIQYLASTAGNGSSCADGDPAIHQAPNSFVLAKDAPRAIGQAFAYPIHIMPPKASEAQVDASVYWWNKIREMNYRAFRTSGLFYSKGEPGTRKRKRKEDKFDDVYRRLEVLERKLGVELSERKDNE
jgi:hypothetical protein